MAKAEQILSYFPAFYRTGESTKLLHEFVRLLAEPISEADTHLMRIQRAHRILVAEHSDDILRLAASLNMTALHFEDLLANTSLDYDLKLDLMRRRVRRVAELHLRGLGTPWSVLQGAAIFLDATLVSQQIGAPLVKHLDAEGFSHEAVMEFTDLADRPRERLVLHENPFQRKKLDLTESWAPAFLKVTNEGMADAPLRVVIQGVSDHTVLPVVYCLQTEEGFLFNGIVPRNTTLVIDSVDGVRLDGEPVDDWLIYFKGGTYDYAQADVSTYVVEQQIAAAPFDGDLGTIVSHPYRVAMPTPLAEVGLSEWRFEVAEGIYDGSPYDFAVYDLPRLPIGVYDGDFSYDQTVFDYPASGVVGFAWDERIGCAFKLLLPAHIPQPEGASQSNVIGRIGTILERFRAAGVRAFIDTAPDAWILGESFIRDQEADSGAGIDFHSTCLRDPHADMLVTL